MFGDFVFPDGTKAQWDSLNALQKLFMVWFNEERRKQVLTFPVETLSLLTKDGEVVDKEWEDFAADMLEEGHSFFIYMSDSVDSLASCCRLRNAIEENTFSYSLGAGGVATGSKSVITINMNRLIQNADKEFEKTKVDGPFVPFLQSKIREQVRDIHKYHEVFNDNLIAFQEAGMLPVYDAGYIDLDSQYLTIGINGALEGAEYLGIKANDNKEYKEFLTNILIPIYEENKAAKQERLMFNTEFVPSH